MKNTKKALFSLLLLTLIAPKAVYSVNGSASNVEEEIQIDPESSSSSRNRSLSNSSDSATVNNNGILSSLYQTGQTIGRSAMHGANSALNYASTHPRVTGSVLGAGLLGAGAYMFYNRYYRSNLDIYTQNVLDVINQVRNNEDFMLDPETGQSDKNTVEFLEHMEKCAIQGGLRPESKEEQNRIKSLSKTACHRDRSKYTSEQATNVGQGVNSCLKVFNFLWTRDKINASNDLQLDQALRKIQVEAQDISREEKIEILTQVEFNKRFPGRLMDQDVNEAQSQEEQQLEEITRSIQ